MYIYVEILVYNISLYQTTPNLQEFSYSPFALNYPLCKNLEVFGWKLNVITLKLTHFIYNKFGEITIDFHH